MRLRADYAADLFTSADPILPALKTTERWFGPDHSILRPFFLANSQPPAQHDWQGWDVTFQVHLLLFVCSALVWHHMKPLRQLITFGGLREAGAGCGAQRFGPSHNPPHAW